MNENEVFPKGYGSGPNLNDSLTDEQLAALRDEMDHQPFGTEILDVSTGVVTDRPVVERPADDGFTSGSAG